MPGRAVVGAACVGGFGLPGSFSSSFCCVPSNMAMMLHDCQYRFANDTYIISYASALADHICANVQ